MHTRALPLTTLDLLTPLTAPPPKTSQLSPSIAVTSDPSDFNSTLQHPEHVRPEDYPDVVHTLELVHLLRETGRPELAIQQLEALAERAASLYDPRLPPQQSGHQARRRQHLLFHLPFLVGVCHLANASRSVALEFFDRQLHDYEAHDAFPSLGTVEDSDQLSAFHVDVLAPLLVLLHERVQALQGLGPGWAMTLREDEYRFGLVLGVGQQAALNWFRMHERYVQLGMPQRAFECVQKACDLAQALGEFGHTAPGEWLYAAMTLARALDKTVVMGSIMDDVMELDKCPAAVQHVASLYRAMDESGRVQWTGDGAIDDAYTSRLLRSIQALLPFDVTRPPDDVAAVLGNGPVCFWIGNLLLMRGRVAEAIKYFADLSLADVDYWPRPCGMLLDKLLRAHGAQAFMSDASCFTVQALAGLAAVCTELLIKHGPYARLFWYRAQTHRLRGRFDLYVADLRSAHLCDPAFIPWYFAHEAGAVNDFFEPHLCAWLPLSLLASVHSRLRAHLSEMGDETEPFAYIPPSTAVGPDAVPHHAFYDRQALALRQVVRDERLLSHIYEAVLAVAATRTEISKAETLWLHAASAELLLLSNKWQQAREKVEWVLVRDANQLLALSVLARCSLRQLSVVRTREVCGRALKLLSNPLVQVAPNGPLDGTAPVDELMYEAGDLRAAQIRTQYANFVALLGAAALLDGDVQQANELCAEALDADKNNAFALYTQFSVFQSLAPLCECVDVLLALYSKHPYYTVGLNLSESPVLRGALYLEPGAMEEEQAVDQARTLVPDSVMAQVVAVPLPPARWLVNLDYRCARGTFSTHWSQTDLLRSTASQWYDRGMDCLRDCDVVGALASFLQALAVNANFVAPLNALLVRMHADPASVHAVIGKSTNLSASGWPSFITQLFARAKAHEELHRLEDAAFADLSAGVRFGGALHLNIAAFHWRRALLLERRGSVPECSDELTMAIVAAEADLEKKRKISLSLLETHGEDDGSDAEADAGDEAVDYSSLAEVLVSVAEAKLEMYCFARGSLYYKAEQYALALKDVSRAIELNASNAEAFRIRSFVHAHLGDLRLAARDLEEYCILEPEDYGLRLRLANTYLRLEQTQSAWVHIRELHEVAPSEPRLQLCRGTYFLMQGRLDDAEIELTSCLKRGVERDSATLRLCSVYERQHRFHEAVALLDAMEARGSTEDGLQLALGRVRFALGNVDTAAEHLQRAVTIDQDSVTGHYLLAYMRLIQGQWATAKRHLTRVLALDGRHIGASYLLGFLRMCSEEWGEAREQFEHVLRLEPKHVEARLCKAMLDKPAGALAVYESLLSSRETPRGVRAVALLNRAIVRSQSPSKSTSHESQVRNDLDKAVQMLSNNETLSSVLNLALLLRAENLRKMGRPREALVDFQRLLPSLYTPAARHGSASSRRRNKPASYPFHVSALSRTAVPACADPRPDLGAGLSRGSGSVLPSVGRPGKVLLSSKEMSDVYTAIGVTHCALGDMKAGFGSFKRASMLTPAHAYSLLDSALVLVDASNVEAAGDSLADALAACEVLDEDKNELTGRVLLESGLVSERLGDFGRAVSFYEQCVEEGYESARSIFQLGSVRFRQKNYEDALERFEQYVQLRPLDPAGRCNRAVCRQLMHNLNGALEDYSKALELTDDSTLATIAKYNRAHLYVELQNPGRALSDMTFVHNNIQALHAGDEEEDGEEEDEERDEEAQKELSEDERKMEDFFEYCKRWQQGLSVACSEVREALLVLPLPGDLVYPPRKVKRRGARSIVHARSPDEGIFIALDPTQMVVWFNPLNLPDRTSPEYKALDGLLEELSKRAPSFCEALEDALRMQRDGDLPGVLTCLLRSTYMIPQFLNEEQLRRVVYTVAIWRAKTQLAQHNTEGAMKTLLEAVGEDHGAEASGIHTFVVVLSVRLGKKEASLKAATASVLADEKNLCGRMNRFELLRRSQLFQEALGEVVEMTKQLMSRPAPIELSPPQRRVLGVLQRYVGALRGGPSSKWGDIYQVRGALAVAVDRVEEGMPLRPSGSLSDGLNGVTAERARQRVFQQLDNVLGDFIQQRRNPTAPGGGGDAPDAITQRVGAARLEEQIDTAFTEVQRVMQAIHRGSASQQESPRRSRRKRGKKGRMRLDTGV